MRKVFKLKIYLFVLLLNKFAVCQINNNDTLVLYYDFNNSNISPSNKDLFISKVSLNLSTQKFDSIELKGYTDTIGTINFNKNLAFKRIISVWNILLNSLVIDSTKVKVKFSVVGEDYNDQISDEKKRRVEILISSNLICAPPLINLNDKKDYVVDTIIELRNIRFKPDSPVIFESSFVELKNILSILKRKYAHSLIEIKGHVNHTDSKLKKTDPLYILSERRAKVIYDFFIDYGFDPKNIKYYGVGNSELFNEEPKTLLEKQSNMRVEIIVLQ